LVALAPDVILASGTSTVAPLLRATRTVPIVFAGVADPVGAGYVGSLARPGGNATGFTTFEYSLGGKWLELLKEIAPGVTRVAVLRDSALAAGSGQLGAIQAVASSFGVELSPVNMLDAGEIEPAQAASGLLRPPVLPEFIAYAKANPGKVNMASAGIGSVHLPAGVRML
jgi:putative tryptophan/tyrosine transport system substrate-binding protein